MNRLTFSCKHRIKHRQEFQNVIYTGYKLQIDFLDIRMKHSLNANQISRLGISVSKKTGSAPMRNYMKRMIREWFRTQRYLFKKPHDMIFLVKRSPAHKIKLQDMTNLLQAPLASIGLL